MAVWSLRSQSRLPILKEWVSGVAKGKQSLIKAISFFLVKNCCQLNIKRGPTIAGKRKAVWQAKTHRNLGNSMTPQRTLSWVILLIFYNCPSNGQTAVFYNTDLFLPFKTLPSKTTIGHHHLLKEIIIQDPSTAQELASKPGDDPLVLDKIRVIVGVQLKESCLSQEPRSVTLLVSALAKYWINRWSPTEHTYWLANPPNVKTKY